MNEYLEGVISKWKTEGGKRSKRTFASRSAVRRNRAGWDKLHKNIYTRQILTGDSPERAGRFADLFVEAGAGPRPVDPDADGRTQLIESRTDDYMRQGRSEEDARRMAHLFAGY